MALQKRERHLNFFSPELVIFAIFDDLLPTGEREAMAKKLFSYRQQFIPGERLIHQLSVPGPYFCTGDAFWLDGRPSLATFVNGRSFLLWELLNHSQAKLAWLNQPANIWEQSAAYGELHFCVNNLCVVNDPAERIVQLAAQRIPTVRSEERLQETLLTVEELRRLAEDFHRGTFTKQQLTTVIRKMLRIE